MRKIITVSSVLAVVFLGLGAASARAEEVVVKVPFPFAVNERTLPAGEYFVGPVDQNPSAILIRSKNVHDHASAIVMTVPAGGEDPKGYRPALTFTHQGNQYRLSTIWESRTEGQVVVQLS